MKYQVKYEYVRSTSVPERDNIQDAIADLERVEKGPEVQKAWIVKKEEVVTEVTQDEIDKATKDRPRPNQSEPEPVEEN